MLNIRVIPCLLLKDQGLVKTLRFKEPKYVGDPINAIKIFNDKEVDELIFLDISATSENRKPNFKLISDIAQECFMPFAYGGGLRDIEDIQKILKIGVEKVIINSFALENPAFVREVANAFGNQSVVVAMDVKKTSSNQYLVYTHSGKTPTRWTPVDWARKVVELGAGELFVNSIDNDGTMEGYDLNVLKEISANVNIPVIACGGAGNLNHFRDAIKTGGASAVAAGSFFVFHGKFRSVLITYPTAEELKKVF
jgi:cyclase